MGGQLICVVGTAGAGKSTLVQTLGDLFDRLNRPCVLVNLDPANENPAYKADLDIRDTITVDDIMEEDDLGPNGALLACLEFVADHVSDLCSAITTSCTSARSRTVSAAAAAGYSASSQCEPIVVLDLPGQIEAYSINDAVSRILFALTRPKTRGGAGLRAVCLHLVDAVAMTDPSAYASCALLCALQQNMLGTAMIHVLSKADKIGENGVVPLDVIMNPSCDEEALGRWLGRGRQGRQRDLRLAIGQYVADEMMGSYSLFTVFDPLTCFDLLDRIDESTGHVVVPDSGEIGVEWGMAQHEDLITKYDLIARGQAHFEPFQPQQ